MNWILDHYKPVSSFYHFSVQNLFVTSRGHLYKAWRRPDVRINCQLSALLDLDDTTSRQDDMTNRQNE